MTKYTKQFTEEKEVIKPTFTHWINPKGVVEMSSFRQRWDNVQLLEGKRENLYQFLVWDNAIGKTSSFTLLGDKGNVFDNI